MHIATSPAHRCVTPPDLTRVTVNAGIWRATTILACGRDTYRRPDITLRVASARCLAAADVHPFIDSEQPPAIDAIHAGKAKRPVILVHKAQNQQTVQRKAGHSLIEELDVLMRSTMRLGSAPANCTQVGRADQH